MIVEVDDTFFTVNEFGSLIIGHTPHNQPEVRNPFLNYMQYDSDDELFQVADTTSGRFRVVQNEIKVSESQGVFRAADKLERAIVLIAPHNLSEDDQLSLELQRKCTELQKMLLEMDRIHVDLFWVNASKYPSIVFMLAKLTASGNAAPTHLPMLLYFADRVVVMPPLFATHSSDVNEIPTVESMAADIIRARRSCRNSVI